MVIRAACHGQWVQHVMVSLCSLSWSHVQHVMVSGCSMSWSVGVACHVGGCSMSWSADAACHGSVIFAVLYLFIIILQGVVDELLVYFKFVM